MSCVCSDVLLSSFQMVCVRVVQVFGLVRGRLEAEARHLSAAGCQRCSEDADGGRLREDEPPGGHGAMLGQQLSHLGDQSVGEGRARGLIKHYAVLEMYSQL